MFCCWFSNMIINKYNFEEICNSNVNDETMKNLRSEYFKKANNYGNVGNFEGWLIDNQIDYFINSIINENENKNKNKKLLNLYPVLWNTNWDNNFINNYFDYEIIFYVLNI